MASMGMHTPLERQDMTILERGSTGPVLRRIFEERSIRMESSIFSHNEHGVGFAFSGRKGGSIDGGDLERQTCGCALDTSRYSTRMIPM